MQWILIISLFHFIGGGGNTIKIEILMPDEITCMTALLAIKVTPKIRRVDWTRRWLESLAEKRPAIGPSGIGGTPAHNGLDWREPLCKPKP